MTLQIKIAAIIAVISVTVAGLITLSSTNVMQLAMENRLEEEGGFIADTLKETLLSEVVGGESVAVFTSIREIVKKNEHIEYIFIVGFDNQLFAHSFAGDFPESLLLSSGTVQIQEHVMQYTPNLGAVIQVSEPLVDGMAARLYVGMNDAMTKAYIHQLNRHILLISFVVMLVMMILGIIFSHRISAPLIRLTRKMSAYGQGKEVDFNDLSGQWVDREVKNLNAAFQTMVLDIQEGIAKLKYSQSSLARAQKIACLGNWDWNIVDNTLYWSDEIYRIFGVTPNEFSASYEEFLKKIHPDDRTLVAEAVETSLKDSAIAYCVEHRIERPNGEVRIVHEHAEIIRDSAGKPLRMTGTVQDITERKQNEQELNRYRNHLEELVGKRTQEVKRQAKIIDQIHDAVIIMDLKGKISFWNKGAERLFHYASSDVVGSNIDLLSPDKSSLLLSRFLEKFHSANGHETEIKLQCANGELLDIYLSLSVISDGEDPAAATSLLGYFIDITARKHAERKLKQRTDELSAVNKELESFSYSVSHDLRTPLRAIDGFSLALLEDYNDVLDKEGKNYLRRVRGGAQRMAQLIDDLLLLSKVTRNSLKFGVVNLSALANEVINELQEAEQRHPLNIKIAPNIVSKGDASLLRLILQNLLGNAWKFTRPKKDAYIEFGVLSESDIPTYFVRDNGVGFNMQYSDKLFRAFQRLHKPEQFEGTGIGLATVQRIVQRHGGHIWAESEEGKGTTFYFTLDDKQEQQIASDAMSQPNPSLQPLLGVDNV